MKSSALWKLTAKTSAEAEDAVSQLLADRFGRAPASYTDRETSQTAVSIYFEQRPDWSRAEQAELAASLKRIKASGIKNGPVHVSLSRLCPQNWAESWKRHFKPIEMGSVLLVRPSWSKRRARKGQVTIVLDPGLSFGTGQHPTTAFCLEQLVAQRRAVGSRSFLDLGSGSGILAIAAARLGYARITAIDHDQDAVRIARANARRNRVADRIRFLYRDVAELPRRPGRKFSLVCANLISTLLLTERERILAQVAENGVLVLAGILKSEFPQIQRTFEAAGLRLVASKVGKEWRSAAFVWK
jgi:ribosomal protein L11 methyltransferase